MTDIKAPKDGCFLFTSESVNEGHPDKLCDQVPMNHTSYLLVGDLWCLGSILWKWKSKDIALSRQSLTSQRFLEDLCCLVYGSSIDYTRIGPLHLQWALTRLTCDQMRVVLVVSMNNKKYITPQRRPPRLPGLRRRVGRLLEAGPG